MLWWPVFWLGHCFTPSLRCCRCLFPPCSVSKLPRVGLLSLAPAFTICQLSVVSLDPLLAWFSPALEGLLRRESPGSFLAAAAQKMLLAWRPLLHCFPVQLRKALGSVCVNIKPVLEGKSMAGMWGSI